MVTKVSCSKSATIWQQKLEKHPSLHTTMKFKSVWRARTLVHLYISQDLLTLFLWMSVLKAFSKISQNESSKMFSEIRYIRYIFEREFIKLILLMTIWMRHKRSFTSNSKSKQTISVLTSDVWTGFTVWKDLHSFLVQSTLENTSSKLPNKQYLKQDIFTFQQLSYLVGFCCKQRLLFQDLGLLLFLKTLLNAETKQLFMSVDTTTAKSGIR